MVASTLVLCNTIRRSPNFQMGSHVNLVRASLISRNWKDLLLLALQYSFAHCLEDDEQLGFAVFLFGCSQSNSDSPVRIYLEIYNQFSVCLSAAQQFLLPSIRKAIFFSLLTVTAGVCSSPATLRLRPALCIDRCHWTKPISVALAAMNIWATLHSALFPKQRLLFPPNESNNSELFGV